LSGLLLLNTIREIKQSGVKLIAENIHDWVPKLDLQPANDASPDHGALNETVIQINGQQFWLRRQSRNHQISPHTAV